MGRTTELQKLVKNELEQTDGRTYHKRADKAASFPYKVFRLNGTTFPDSTRDDYMLQIDLWDQGENARRIEEIADKIEDRFNAVNLPQTTILPTFFKEGRVSDDNTPPTEHHIILTFLIQLYTKEE